MKKILLTNQYKGEALALVRSQIPDGFAIEFLTEQTQAALETQIADADYLLAGGRLKVTKAVLAKAGKLRMIQRSGVGLDSLDLDAIRTHEIPLYVNQGVNAQSVAEHTLLLMLACLRRLTEIDRNTRNGVWKKQEQGVRTAELRGRTVGIIGMGSIARRLVSLLRPFEVQILYYSAHRAPQVYEQENQLCFVSQEELLARSDIVTLHCPLTEQTRGLICRESLQQMRDGSILINTARGGVVVTEDLAEALRSGKLAYAGLDVHEAEPLPDGYILKELDNVILTPHIGGVTSDSLRAMMHDAFRNIALFEQGRRVEIEPFRYL